jgi:high-affinity iron transporter
MMRAACRFGIGACAVLALFAFIGAARAAEAAPEPTIERFEVSSIKAVRPLLVETLSAIRDGDVARAKQSFEAYDSAWNGIEVYINVRSKALYEVLELDLQAKITKALDASDPDLGQLGLDAQTMLAKYDEVIDLVSNAPALNEIYDDLARLRIVRTYLRDVNPALKAGNLAKARKSFEAFDDMWFDIEDFVRAQSLDAYVAIERGMLQIEEALMPEMPDIARVQTLVAGIMRQYNAVVTGVQKQARTAH